MVCLSLSGRVLTTPAVRKLAKQYGLDLSAIKGSGRDQRVMKNDVLQFINNPSAQSTPAATTTSTSFATQSQPSSPATPTPAVTPTTAAATAAAEPGFATPSPVPGTPSEHYGLQRVEPIRGVAKAMFKSMTAANQVPQFLLCDEIDVTELVGLREQLKQTLAKHSENVQLSFMPFFIKATSMALRQHPILNSSVSSDQVGSNFC
jgi:2-oxoisovalerate dehydrogenase E2 component (dihydrolipoyl transacylase)